MPKVTNKWLHVSSCIEGDSKRSGRDTTAYIDSFYSVDAYCSAYAEKIHHILPTDVPVLKNIMQVIVAPTTRRIRGRSYCFAIMLKTQHSIPTPPTPTYMIGSCKVISKWLFSRC